MRPVVASTLEAGYRAMKMSMLSALRVPVTLRQQESSLTLTIREAAPVTAKDRSSVRPSVSLPGWPQADRYSRVAREPAKASGAFLLAAPRPALGLLVAERRGDWHVAPELASALGKKALLEVPSWCAQTAVRQPFDRDAALTA